MECSICFNLLTEEGELPNPGPAQGPAPKRARVGNNASGPKLCTTSCGHVYHRVCIMNWVDRGDRTCPTCRKPITKRAVRSVFLPTVQGPPDGDNAEQEPVYVAVAEDGQGQVGQEEPKGDFWKGQINKLIQEKVELQEKFHTELEAVKTSQADLQRNYNGLLAHKRKLEGDKADLQLRLQEAEDKMKDLQECFNTLAYDMNELTLKRSEELEKMANLEVQVVVEKEKAEETNLKLFDLRRVYGFRYNDNEALKAELAKEKEKSAELQRKVTDLEVQLARDRPFSRDQKGPSNWNYFGGGGQGGGY